MTPQKNGRKERRQGVSRLDFGTFYHWEDDAELINQIERRNPRWRREKQRVCSILECIYFLIFWYGTQAVGNLLFFNMRKYVSRIACYTKCVQSRVCVIRVPAKMSCKEGTIYSPTNDGREHTCPYLWKIQYKIKCFDPGKLDCRNRQYFQFVCFRDIFFFSSLSFLSFSFIPRYWVELCARLNILPWKNLLSVKEMNLLSLKDITNVSLRRHLFLLLYVHIWVFLCWNSKFVCRQI